MSIHSLDLCRPAGFLAFDAFALGITRQVIACSRRKGIKIHATCDALGNPLGFFLTGGQACDLDGADHLIGDLDAQILLADKGYDADARVIKPLISAGRQVVIPPKSNRKVQRYYDKALYKARHLIDNFFENLKYYRAIATRYDKTAAPFLGAIHLVSCLIWLK